MWIFEHAAFDWVGIFPYSQEEDTSRCGNGHQVPEDVKMARYDYAMSLLSRCSANHLEKMVLERRWRS